MDETTTTHHIGYFSAFFIFSKRKQMTGLGLGLGRMFDANP